MMAVNFIKADHPAGILYAAVDETARFCESAISHSRLGAALKPFKSSAAAFEALAAAGATVEPTSGKGRVVTGVT